MLRIGRDEDQYFQPLPTIVLDTVRFARWSHSALAGSQHAFFLAHLKRPLSFKDQIHLILLPMDMAFLFLTWLEAVNIAEKPWSLKEIVFLHLISAKYLIISQFYNFHFGSSGEVLQG